MSRTKFQRALDMTYTGLSRGEPDKVTVWVTVSDGRNICLGALANENEANAARYVLAAEIVRRFGRAGGS